MAPRARIRRIASVSRFTLMLHPSSAALHLRSDRPRETQSKRCYSLNSRSHARHAGGRELAGTFKGEVMVMNIEVA